MKRVVKLKSTTNSAAPAYESGVFEMFLRYDVAALKTADPLAFTRMRFQPSRGAFDLRVSI
jgi:hypothetical protein